MTDFERGGGDDVFCDVAKIDVGGGIIVVFILYTVEMLLCACYAMRLIIFHLYFLTMCR